MKPSTQNRSSNYFRLFPFLYFLYNSLCSLSVVFIGVSLEIQFLPNAKAEPPTFELSAHCYYDSNNQLHCEKPPSPTYIPKYDYESSKEAYGRAQEARAARKAAATAIREEKKRLKEEAKFKEQEKVQEQNKLTRYKEEKNTIYHLHYNSTRQAINLDSDLLGKTLTEVTKINSIEKCAPIDEWINTKIIIERWDIYKNVTSSKKSIFLPFVGDKIGLIIDDIEYDETNYNKTDFACSDSVKCNNNDKSNEAEQENGKTANSNDVDLSSLYKQYVDVPVVQLDNENLYSIKNDFNSTFTVSEQQFLEQKIDQSEPMIANFKTDYMSLFAGLDDALSYAIDRSRNGLDGFDGATRSNFSEMEVDSSEQNLRYIDEFKEFMFKGDTASSVTQFAIRLTPVGDVLNICELITGKELCSQDGREFDAVERGLAAAGVIIRGGSIWKKALGKIGSVVTSTSIKTGEKIIESAAKLGAKTGESVKDLTNIAKSSAGESSELIAKNIDQYAEAARLGVGPKLPIDQVSNFKNGQYFNRKLQQDEIFYRYHGVNNRTGKEFVYTVKNEYQNEKTLRDGVGILEEWGVQITGKSKIQAPASSWVSEGLAASQKGLQEVRPGGDYQSLFSMPDIPKSWILNTTKAFP